MSALGKGSCKGKSFSDVSLFAANQHIFSANDGRRSEEVDWKIENALKGVNKVQSEDEVKFQVPRLRVPPSQETTPCCL